MQLLSLIQATTLIFGLSMVRLQSGPVRMRQYEVILYEGLAPDSYQEDARKDLQPEKPRLSMRVEEGEKFHAESNDAMFEGKILSVKEGNIDLRIDRSHLFSTACSQISVSVELNKAVYSNSGCVFSSIFFMYYFRVNSVTKEGAEGDVPNNGIHLTANSGAFIH